MNARSRAGDFARLGGRPLLFRLSVRGACAAACELLLRLCRPCAMGLVEVPALDAYLAELTAE